MTKRADRRLQKAISGAIGTRERKVERIPGFLGTFVNGEKTIRVPDRKDFVFVRLRMDQSEVIEAFNDQVADNFDTPVTVIRDPSAPRFYRVISREIATFQDWGSPYLINHAEQHMFSGGTGTTGSDVVWVYRRAFVPLGVSPNGSMTANVASDYYAWDQGIRHFGPTGTVNFSAIRDSLGIFEARFVTVFLNGGDSELNYITGEIFDNTAVVTDPTQFISVPDPNEGIPLAAIYLFNSMTEVLWDDIFDIRQIIQGIGGNAGGSGVNWQNVIIVAKSGGDHTTITAALAAASSGDVVLVMPGTYAESITLVAGVIVVGIANSTGPVIIAPAAGTVVTIPSGAGTYQLHNCTLTPPSSTATVTDNMGASGLATLYRVSIGTSGGGDSIDSSGGNAGATLTLEECRIAGNFTQFSICDFIDCISTSAINPAASAGDLTIYGGEVAAEVDDVIGQTVAFLNTPFIGGVVTGAGTLFGEYLDGNSWDISLGAFVAPVGLVGTPTYRFSGDVDTGFYQPAADHIGISIGGVQQGLWGSGELQLPSYDVRLAAGDVDIEAGDLFVTSLFTGGVGFGIPFVQASTGLFGTSSLFGWDGIAMQVNSESGSNPRGFHGLQSSNTAGDGAQWTASRSRGTIASPSAVTTDDRLGEFRFRGFDSTFTDTVAEIVVFAAEPFTVTDNGTYITFSTTPIDSVTLAEVVRITDVGFVGIGTSTPDTRLDVRADGTDTDILTLRSDLGTFDRDMRIISPASDSASAPFRFETNNAFAWEIDDVEVMRIDSNGDFIWNELGGDRDFRIEGDTMQYMFFMDATNTTENLAFVATGAPNWNTMDRGLFIGNVANAPNNDPSIGGYLYVVSGAGTWRGSSGTVTTFAPAGPHCKVCGYDFWRVHYQNDKWGASLWICEWCGEEHRSGPKSVMDKLSEVELSELV